MRQGEFIMKNGKLKKLITLATVVASTFALAACGSSSSDDSKGSDSSAKKDSGFRLGFYLLLQCTGR